MSRRVVISSLEEDFQRIGLTPPAKPAKKPVREQDGAPAAGAPPDEEEDEPDKPDDETEETDPDLPAAGDEEEDPAVPDDEETDVPDPAKPKAAKEWIRKRVAALAKIENRGGAPKPKAKPKTESRKPAPKPRASAGTKLSTLMEEVQGLVTSIRRDERNEHVRAFANIALISEYLGRAFASFGRQLKEKSLFAASRHMRTLAEGASDMAVGLDVGEEPEKDKDEEPELTPAEKTAAEMGEPEVQKEFKSMMGKLLNALDLYDELDPDEPSDEEEDPTVPAGEEEDDPKKKPWEEGDDEPPPDAPPSDEEDDVPPGDDDEGIPPEIKSEVEPDMPSDEEDDLPPGDDDEGIPPEFHSEVDPTADEEADEPPPEGDEEEDDPKKIKDPVSEARQRLAKAGVIRKGKGRQLKQSKGIKTAPKPRNAARGRRSR